MNKNKSGRKFGRKRNPRRALLKNLASSLILKEKIITTEAKAKTLRMFIEPLVTRAKNDNVFNRRFLARRLGREVVRRIFSVLAPRYGGRYGGYLRITKRISRKTDDSKTAAIEFI